MSENKFKIGDTVSHFNKKQKAFITEKCQILYNTGFIIKTKKEMSEDTLNFPTKSCFLILSKNILTEKTIFKKFKTE